MEPCSAEYKRFLKVNSQGLAHVQLRSYPTALAFVTLKEC